MITKAQWKWMKHLITHQKPLPQEWISLSHLLKEVFCTRPLHHIDVGCSTIDVYWDCIIWVSYLVELTVHKSFIKIKN